MNLSELLQSPPDLATLRGLALILTPELHTALAAAQAALPGERRFTVAALELTDGRYMLGADLLSEIGPGELYVEGFGQLSPDVFPSVEVLPMADALALRPVVELELPTP